MFQIYAGDALVYEPGDSDLVLLTPKLTLEMGKAGSLEFTVPAGHPYTTELKQLTKPVSVSLDGETVFRGRILSGTRTFYNQREVYCEGDLSYLVDSVQKAVKYDGTAKALFTQIINNHNARMPVEKQFTVGNVTAVTDQQDIHLLGQTDDITQYDYKQVAINSIVDNWNTTFDYIETCLISYFGGYLMTRRVNNTTYIDWVADYTNTATQEIIFGENLLDLTDETTAEDIFTVLIPIGDENLTIKSVNHDSDEIVDEAKVVKYGRIVKTNVFSNVTEAQTLLENGRQYLANNGDVPTTFTLTAIDLHSVYPEVQAIRLGDRVYIRSDPHELSQYLTCTKIEYDLEKPENTVYTFGREKQTLTHRYREDKRAQNDTYGNSATGGGGIGAAAADEAGGWHWLSDDILDATDEKIEESEDKTDQKLQDLFDAWIQVTPEQGEISLGTLYQKVLDDEYVLKNNAGIDVSAPAGTVNIYSTATDLKNNEDKTAQIVTWAGEDEDGNIGTKIALKAEVTEVSGRLEGIEAVFNRIEGNTAYLKTDVSTSSVYSNHYFINTTQGDSLDLVSHYHNITTTSNGDGLVIGPPIGIDDRVPFLIANTQAYQDGVLAVVLDDLVGISYDFDDNLMVGTVPLKDNTVYSDQMLYGCLKTTLSNDNVKNIRVGLNAEKAYKAGEAAGTNDVILTGLAGTTYSAEDDILSGTVDSESNTIYSGGMIFGCLTTTLKNGKTRTIRVGLAGDLAYDKGKSDGISEGASSVSIATTTRRSYTAGTDHSVSVTDTRYLYGLLYGTIDATLTNGNTETIYVGMEPPTETRSATYTTNGLRTINVNSGIVGMTSVTINVNVPQPAPNYATFQVVAISPSGQYVYIRASTWDYAMRFYQGDYFDQT